MGACMKPVRYALVETDSPFNFTVNADTGKPEIPGREKLKGTTFNYRCRVVMSDDTEVYENFQYTIE